MRCRGLVSEWTRTPGSCSRSLVLAALVLSGACGRVETPGSADSTPPPSAAGMGGKGGSTIAGGTGGTSAAGGLASSSGAGGLTAAGAGGLAAAAGSGAVSASGSGGDWSIPPINKDNCLYGYSPQGSDDTMRYGPDLFTPPGGGAVDTVVQPEVLQWMTDNKWPTAHLLWHAVRGCTNGTTAGLLQALGFPNLCRDYPVLIPEDQNCASVGDGYQFLLAHRYMIETLKQLWPKHAADFDGFPKFPTTRAELPTVWNATNPTWSAEILAAAEIADKIEQHLDKFPNEGAVGYWLQCPVGASAPGFAPQLPYIGLHSKLHEQWSRGSSSPHGLNNDQDDVTNYMFWKLHGWIDKVWEKYRVAKGLTKPDSPEMQKYKKDLAQQCYAMSIEPVVPGPGISMLPDDPDCAADANETGDFHNKVRPLFEAEANHCSSCHGPARTSPYAQLTLGGQISSRCVVERLKRASNDGGQFKLLEPGDPDKSWLYLKASGKAATAGCISLEANRPCNSATMPPSGKTMTDPQLEILRKWIADGATYP